jgi:hypothetical protein
MRGARLLTVSASTLHSSAARDVQHIRSSDGLGDTATRKAKQLIKRWR